MRTVFSLFALAGIATFLWAAQGSAMRQLDTQIADAELAEPASVAFAVRSTALKDHQEAARVRKAKLAAKKRALKQKRQRRIWEPASMGGY